MDEVIHYMVVQHKCDDILREEHNGIVGPLLPFKKWVINFVDPISPPI